MLKDSSIAITYEMLTGDMQMVADVIGVEEVVTLCRQLGGVVIHIPKEAHSMDTRDGLLLHRALPHTLATALYAELGGVTVNIPMIATLLKKQLPEIIKKEYDGRNKKQLALKYGIGQRTVEQYLQHTPPRQIPGQVSIWEHP